MLIAYARTSTDTQTAGLEEQRRALTAQGAEKVFSEHASAVSDRPQFRAVMEFMREGDCLVVTTADRLARSTVDLLTIIDQLDARKIGLVIMSMGGQTLDTRSPTSRLILTILAGVATWEREILLERQRIGIAAAKADGKYKGRAPTARNQTAEVIACKAEGMTAIAIAHRLAISKQSVWRILAEQAVHEVAGAN